jgi:hypothetical protein
MLLNRHVALGGASDPAALVREDLRALAKLPLNSSRVMAVHTQARLALLRKDTGRATALLRQSAADYDASDRPDEAARERYALGIVIGGHEGDTLRAQAARKLSDSGYADPGREMQTYYPELIGRGA